MQEYTKTLKLFAMVVLGIHIVGFSMLFPKFMFYLFYIPTMTLITGALLWKYVELIDLIETENRNSLLHLIEQAETETAKYNLRYQLYRHDRESIRGDPTEHLV